MKKDIWSTQFEGADSIFERIRLVSVLVLEILVFESFSAGRPKTKYPRMTPRVSEVMCEYVETPMRHV